MPYTVTCLRVEFDTFELLEALARGDVPFATAAIALERTVGPATTL